MNVYCVDIKIDICKWADESVIVVPVQNQTSGGATKCIIHQMSENSKTSVHRIQRNGISSAKRKSMEILLFLQFTKTPRFVPQLFATSKISKHIKTIHAGGASHPACSFWIKADATAVPKLCAKMSMGCLELASGIIQSGEVTTD